MELPAIISCPEWSEHETDPNSGRCARGLFGGSPNKKTCLKVCTVPNGDDEVERQVRALKQGACCGDRGSGE